MCVAFRECSIRLESGQQQNLQREVLLIRQAEYQKTENNDSESNIQIINAIKQASTTNNFFLLVNPTKEGYKFIEWEVLGEGSSIEDNIFIMGTEEVVLIAQWELIVPDIESTSNYKLKEDLIKNISLGTDLNDFNLGLDSIYNVKIYNKDLVEKTKGNIATGDKIRIYLDDLLVIEYIAVVKGDVTGTGTSTVSDVAKLYQYLKKKITMEECYVEAGNVVDIDNEIKINDVAKLYQFIKGKINSLED